MCQLIISVTKIAVVCPTSQYVIHHDSPSKTLTRVPLSIHMVYSVVCEGVCRYFTTALLSELFETFECGKSRRYMCVPTKSF